MAAATPGETTPIEQGQATLDNFTDLNRVTRIDVRVREDGQRSNMLEDVRVADRVEADGKKRQKGKLAGAGSVVPQPGMVPAARPAWQGVSPNQLRLATKNQCLVSFHEMPFFRSRFPRMYIGQIVHPCGDN